ncbi:MAG TPA: hypothetical protein VM934_14910 [Pyrinomonadaceae bacterium]|jgi:septal ring factor EnvC (AmiA/AmiB activator)|nr:hypothetical protein [Pyrinomonadaceae bacterium]
MTNEEIQRVMEFIIKQQESFSESMGQMRDSHAKSESRISRLETATVNLYNAVTDIGKAHQKLTERVTQLAEAQTQLAEAQTHTDQRLNVLIDIIEQGRDGKSQS